MIFFSLSVSALVFFFSFFFVFSYTIMRENFLKRNVLDIFGYCFLIDDFCLYILLQHPRPLYLVDSLFFFFGKIWFLQILTTVQRMCIELDHNQQMNLSDKFSWLIGCLNVVKLGYFSYFVSLYDPIHSFSLLFSALDLMIFNNYQRVNNNINLSCIVRK